jgi:ABC-type Mn2+/Zn2+ transport system permease subunit
MLVSVVGSFFGIYFSTHFNFPAGSSVVAMLGLIFLAAAVVRLLRPTGSIAPPVE